MTSDRDSEVVAQALQEFFRAMELRTQRNVRVATRVTTILRVAMVSFVLFGFLMAGMIWVFTDRIRVVTEVLGTMRIEFSQMAKNMSEMHDTLGGLERDMVSFSVVANEMHVMRTTISAMNAEVKEMAERMGRMSGDVNLVTGHVVDMNQSFRLLSPAVTGIGANVNRGAAPMKTFDDLFPFSRMLP